jgi:hypothetical protein
VQARAAAVQRDLAGIRHVYDALQTWDMRFALVWTVGTIGGMDAILREASIADPSSTLALVLLASQHIEEGWRARTNYRIKYVSRKRLAAFHDHLRIAEQILIDVTAREPDNLAAWTLRLTTGRGLELGQSEARRRYDQTAKNDPHHLAAQVTLLQQLCPKWGGSFDAMLAFARERSFASPEGSLNAALIVEGHLERWVELSGKASNAYLRDPAVRDEVARAAAHSVLHPAFRPAYNWVSAHSTFALYHSLAGDYSAAAVHFRAMGPYAVIEPWTYVLPQGLDQFRQQRARALKKG